MKEEQELKVKALELAVKYFASLPGETQFAMIRKHKQESKDKGEEYVMTDTFFAFANEFLKWMKG